MICILVENRIELERVNSADSQIRGVDRCIVSAPMDELFPYRHRRNFAPMVIYRFSFKSN